MKNNITYLYPYLKKYKGKILIVVISLLIIASLVLSFGLALKHLIDIGFTNEENLHKIIFYSIIITITLGATSFIRSYFINYMVERMVTDIRFDIYSKLIYFEPQYFELHKTGDIISRLTNDAQLFLNNIGFVFSSSIRNLILVFGSLFIWSSSLYRLPGHGGWGDYFYLFRLYFFHLLSFLEH